MKRYKVSRSLADGVHWSVVDTAAQLVELIEIWASEPREVREGFSVQIVDMSDEEVAALPDL